MNNTEKSRFQLHQSKKKYLEIWMTFVSNELDIDLEIKVDIQFSLTGLTKEGL